MISDICKGIILIINYKKNILYRFIIEIVIKTN